MPCTLDVIVCSRINHGALLIIITIIIVMRHIIFCVVLYGTSRIMSLQINEMNTFVSKKWRFPCYAAINTKYLQRNIKQNMRNALPGHYFRKRNFNDKTLTQQDEKTIRSKTHQGNIRLFTIPRHI